MSSPESVGSSTASPENYPVDQADAAPEQSATDEPTPGGYAYGPPPTIVRDTNYISDENLLVWLAQKQEGFYGELREHMDMSKARSKLMADLNHLKSELDRGDGMTPTEIKAEIEALQAQYKGTVFEEDLNQFFATPLAEIEAFQELATTQPGAAGLDYAGLAKQLSTSIESKVDELGRDDQLELIEIQSLSADIREVSQLASNLVASGAQAANTIVGNIGR